MLGAGKDQYLRPRAIQNEFFQQGFFRVPIDGIDFLRDAFSRCGLRRDFNALWITQQRTRKATNFRRESGREQEVLPLLWQ